jgi:glucose/arabinose dehydrogenase
MRRVASFIAVVILTASCGQSTTTTTTSTTSEILSGTVSYSSQEIGTLPGAVDLIQRDIADSFFYVVSRFGTIQRWQPDGTVIDTVLDISAATTSEGERGLLGLTFRKIDTQWEAFINFTDLSGDSVISRFDVSGDGHSVVGTQLTGAEIIKIDQPYSNHNGGAVVVGPDNMLYIGTGDGGFQ